MSMILYPFKMPIAFSPLEGKNGDGAAVTFHFRVLPLWRFNPLFYFEKRIYCMYAFLPAMGGVTRDMLLQALDLMVQYYRDRQDENGLREDFLCFGVLLRRAEILSSEDMKEVTNKMVLYDPFIMEDPHFGGIIREKAEEARIEGEAKGRTEVIITLKNMLLSAVKERFPALEERLEEADWPEEIEALGLLTMRLATAANEEAVCRVLHMSAN